MTAEHSYQFTSAAPPYDVPYGNRYSRLPGREQKNNPCKRSPVPTFSESKKSNEVTIVYNSKNKTTSEKSETKAIENITRQIQKRNRELNNQNVDHWEIAGMHENNWLHITNNVFTATSFGNATKEGIIRTALQYSDETAAISNYLKVMKWVGGAGYIIGMTDSALKIHSDIQKGGITNINPWDAVDFGANLAGLTATFFLASTPVGWAIIMASATYLTARLIYEQANKEKK